MKTKTWVAGIVIAGVAAVLFWQWAENKRLRAELAARTSVPTQIELPKSEFAGHLDELQRARLESEHAELMRLRAEAAAFREAKREFTNAQTVISQLKSNLVTAG